MIDAYTHSSPESCFCLLFGGVQLKYEEASQVATDAVGGIRTVASFCAEQKVMDAYAKKCQSPTRQGMKEGVVGGLGFGFSFLVFYLTYALCFYVGAKFVHDGKATFPEVFRVRANSHSLLAALIVLNNLVN
jgi:ABC-type bacteriocin/lantibiotic exporter with double-glycine peptidase domain